MALFTKTAPKPAPKRLGDAWRDLAPYVGRSRARIIALAASSVVSGFAEAMILLLVVRVAVAISLEPGAPVRDVSAGLLSVELSVARMLALSSILAVVKLGADWLAAWLPARISSGIQAELRRETFDAYAAADWETQTEDREGQLQETLTLQINQAAQAVLFLANALAMVVNVLAVIASAVLINPLAAGVILLTAAGLFFVFRPLSRIARRHAAAQADANVAFATTTSEAVATSQEIKVLGATDAVRAEVGERIEDIEREFFMVQYLSGLLPAIYRLVALLVVIVGLAALTRYARDNFAEIGAIALLLVRALSYSQGLQTMYNKVTNLAPYMDRVLERQAHYLAHPARDQGAPVQSIDEISFDRVSYSYSRGVAALEDVSLTIRRGESIGVVGPSGAGKSTLVQLLLRLREPTAGAMLVNSVDATTLSTRDWYGLVAYVPQDSRLVTGTVADNIRFYRPDVSDEDVERAARLAHIHDEIVAWPDGYATNVGQRADAVSGGQRQRLALARALVRDPDLLILDEPTSALDMKSESLVHESLEELRGRLTLVIVAHRLSTLNVCDRILVLHEGRVDAFGTRDEVAATNEFFSEALALSRLP